MDLAKSKRDYADRILVMVAYRDHTVCKKSLKTLIGDLSVTPSVLKEARKKQRKVYRSDVDRIIKSSVKFLQTDLAYGDEIEPLIDKVFRTLKSQGKNLDSYTSWKIYLKYLNDTEECV